MVLLERASGSSRQGLKKYWSPPFLDKQAFTLWGQRKWEVVQKKVLQETMGECMDLKISQ